MLSLGYPIARSKALQVLLGMALAWCLSRLLQMAWPMLRPFSLHVGMQWLAHRASASFPSTHATVASAFALGVALSVRAWFARAVVALCVLWVAWSRVSLGLHFPSDVGAGLMLGVPCALMAAWIGLYAQTAWRSRINRPCKS